MSDVRKLRVAAETKPKPDAGIAAILKKLTDDNEAGNLAGLIVCIETHTGYDWAWAGIDLTSGIGQVEACKAMMIEEMFE